MTWLRKQTHFRGVPMGRGPKLTHRKTAVCGRKLGVNVALESLFLQMGEEIFREVPVTENPTR
jgi:hypothetical protein